MDWWKIAALALMVLLTSCGRKVQDTVINHREKLVSCRIDTLQVEQLKHSLTLAEWEFYHPERTDSIGRPIMIAKAKIKTAIADTMTVVDKKVITEVAQVQHDTNIDESVDNGNYQWLNLFFIVIIIVSLVWWRS